MSPADANRLFLSTQATDSPWCMEFIAVGAEIRRGSQAIAPQDPSASESKLATPTTRRFERPTSCRSPRAVCRDRPRNDGFHRRGRRGTLREPSHRHSTSITHDSKLATPTTWRFERPTSCSSPTPRSAGTSRPRSDEFHRRGCRDSRKLPSPHSSAFISSQVEVGNANDSAIRTPHVLPLTTPRSAGTTRPRPRGYVTFDAMITPVLQFSFAIRRSVRDSSVPHNKRTLSLCPSGQFG